MDDAATILADARRLLVVSGAGVSTASGIPDFRSPGGIWSRFDPREFAFERWRADPAGFWRLRAALMDALELDRVAPNPAHDALARASRSARFLGHVTQNIDGLFARAGHDPERLVEIHGSASRVRCLACDGWFPYAVAQAAVDAGRLPPPCPACGGPLKPGTVLFGESLPPRAWAQAEAWARHADVVLVAGSSLVVHPVAGLPERALERGARLVIANAEPTPADADADALVRGDVSATLPRLLAQAGLAQR